MQETLFQISSAGAYFAHAIFTYAIIIYAQSVTGTTAQSGLLFVLLYAPMLLLGLYAGTVADRRSRKRILLWSQLCSGTLTVVASAAIASDRSELAMPILMATCPLYGAALAFMPATRLAFVANLLPEAAVQRCTVVLKILNVAAIAGGPMIAGWVKASADWPVVFAVPVALWVLSTLLLFPLRVLRETPAASEDARSWTDLKAGLQLITRTGILWGLALVSSIIFCLVSGPVQVLVPGFAKDVLEVDEVQRATLMGVFGGGLLVGGIASAALNHVRGRGRVLMGTLLLSALLFCGFAYQASYNASLVLLGLCSTAGGIFYSLVPATLQAATPDQFRGRVLSVYYLLLLGGPAIGAAGFGWLASSLGLSPTLKLAGVGALVVSAVSTLTLRAITQYTIEPAPTPPPAR
jgi:MFS family permease